MEAADWYINSNLQYIKPVIVHDYSGIANWALGYWGANKKVSMAYSEYMWKYMDIFDYEKVSGHSGHKWNDYADELASRGYEEISNKE